MYRLEEYIILRKVIFYVEIVIVKIFKNKLEKTITLIKCKNFRTK